MTGSIIDPIGSATYREHFSIAPIARRQQGGDYIPRTTNLAQRHKPQWGQSNGFKTTTRRHVACHVPKSRQARELYLGNQILTYCKHTQGGTQANIRSTKRVVQMGIDIDKADRLVKLINNKINFLSASAKATQKTVCVCSLCDSIAYACMRETHNEREVKFLCTNDDCETHNN